MQRKPDQPHGHTYIRTHTQSEQNQIKFKMHHKIQYVNIERDKLINADF